MTIFDYLNNFFDKISNFTGIKPAVVAIILLGIGIIFASKDDRPKKIPISKIDSINLKKK